jgi:NAD(P)H-hydrate epimerase
MGKGGSGDALSGIIGALLSQGYDVKTASILGVFVHGLAGDIAREQLGLFGMTATGIIDQIPKAFQEVKKTSK